MEKFVITNVLESYCGTISLKKKVKKYFVHTRIIYLGKSHGIGVVTKLVIGFR